MKASDIEHIDLHTQYGCFQIGLFQVGPESCLLIKKRWLTSDPVIRIHSECLFGEVFHSLHCECQFQLEGSLRLISQHGGLVIYLFQEGRGAGLEKKIAAMRIEQLLGIDTASAYKYLGMESDLRNYGIAVSAMKSIEVPKYIRLVTNNPAKIRAVEEAGFVIAERVEPRLYLSQKTADLVREKQSALGHIPFTNLEILPNCCTQDEQH
jgi:GTP cyclohydrolase II